VPSRGSLPRDSLFCEANFRDLAVRPVRCGCGPHAAGSFIGGQPHERRSDPIGAGWGRGRSLDRSTAVVSILPSLRSVSGVSRGPPAHLRAVAVRSVWRRGSGRCDAPLPGGDATADGKTAQGSLRNATPSVLHQRHVGRVLRSSCIPRGRRLASSRGRKSQPGQRPSLWPGDLPTHGISMAAAVAGGSKT